jgi:hypothetical protein
MGRLGPVRWTTRVRACQYEEEDDDKEYERGESKGDTARTRDARGMNKMSRVSLAFGTRFDLGCSTTVLYSQKLRP